MFLFMLSRLPIYIMTSYSKQFTRFAKYTLRSYEFCSSTSERNAHLKNYFFVLTKAIERPTITYNPVTNIYR